ncbi:MAG: hypothetical protein AAF570_24890, partial [Bacteroidota bacterium]
FVRARMGKVNLKDYEDYSEKSRKVLDEITELGNAYQKRQIVSWDPVLPMPSKDVPPSAKGYYKGPVVDKYNQSFRKEFEEMMKKGFDYCPFEVEAFTDGVDESKDVVIDIVSNVRNMDDKYQGVAIPALYTVTTTRTGSLSKTFTGYLFGVSIDSEVAMMVPGADDPFKLKVASDPGEHLYNLKGSGEDYENMTKSTFESLAQNLAGKFGFGDEKK